MFFFCLSILKDILIPLAIAAIVAILLNPLFTRLQKRKVPRILAIIITLLVALVAMTIIMYFISSQLARFSDSIPTLKERSTVLLTQSERWLKNTFGLSGDKQAAFLGQTIEKGKALLGQTVTTALGTLGLMLLIPVYVFLLLFYKPLILNFMFEIFAEENSKQVGEILKQTKSSIQSYMVGLLLEALVVAALNIAALLLLGVKYAVLLGVLGALLNMIPYLGGVIAIALPLAVATMTKDGFTTHFLILGSYTLIQFIDNNILVPRIVSSKVQINALISIVAVLLGGTLWGIAGMFLSIPFVAILKIIFDRIDDLKPWGKLLGDEVPTRHMGQIWNSWRRKPVVVQKVV
jgi:predicted PurR-regulated permease PerM